MRCAVGAAKQVKLDFEIGEEVYTNSEMSFLTSFIALATPETTAKGKEEVEEDEGKDEEKE